MTRNMTNLRNENAIFSQASLIQGAFYSSSLGPQAKDRLKLGATRKNSTVTLESIQKSSSYGNKKIKSEYKLLIQWIPDITNVSGTTT